MLKYILLVLTLASACSKAQNRSHSGRFLHVIEWRIKLDQRTKTLIENESLELIIKGIEVSNGTAASVRVFFDVEDVDALTSINNEHYISSFVINSKEGKSDYLLQVNNVSRLKNSIKGKRYILISLVAMPLFDGSPKIHVEDIQLTK